MAPNVLLVQRDSPQRQEGQAVLSLIGCAVTVTDSASEAQHLAFSTPYDFVVLELLLEDGNAYRLADAIRDSESASRRACILATGNFEADQEALCKECGIDEMVNLNRDPDGLSAILHKWMAKVVFRMWKKDDFTAPTLNSLSVTT